MADLQNEGDVASSKRIHVNILIIGSGPTGLGASTRIHELQRNDKERKRNLGASNDGVNSNTLEGQSPVIDLENLTHLLIDSNDSAGGLSSTFCTKEKFLFDLGGHVIFSHYAYFDDLLQYARGSFSDTSSWSIHKRESFVYVDETFVPYPFQFNFGMMKDVEKRMQCLKGLIDLHVEKKVQEQLATTTTGTEQKRIQNFDEWIQASMGKGIHSIFMKPYNFKVWAYPTTEMSATWLGERVAPVDLDLALLNVLKHRDEKDGNEKSSTKKDGWGPNSTFAFPANGGTGSIWSAVAKKAILQENQRFNCAVTGIDLERKCVTCQDGSEIVYDHVINTMPLDVTLKMVGRDDLAEGLRYSSAHIIGLGVRGSNPHSKKCWLYYPQEDVSFYRCTIFSNYAKANCPGDDELLPTLCRASDYTGRVGEGCNEQTTISSDDTTKSGPYHSFMFEVASSTRHKPVNIDTIVADTIRGAIKCKLINPETEIVSVFHKRLERGYPTPHLERDNVLNEALPFLLSHGMYSRGRFGSWKYEVSNQDHSLMLGVEAVDNIIFNSPEVSLNDPNSINGNKGVKVTDRRYYHPVTSYFK